MKRTYLSVSLAADGNFPSATHKAEEEKAMKKNETKKKTMMAGGGDGGACG